MRELLYVESNPNARSYCSFPYTCTTNTSIVFKNLYIPRQPNNGSGHNLFDNGPGRFQSIGECLQGDVPSVGASGDFIVEFGNWNWAGFNPYYQVTYSMPNGLEGDLEIGNGYIKLNGKTVATGTTYTGNKVTLTQPFYLFNHFNNGWSNWIYSGKCGQVIFYEEGVETARFTPYEDDNGVAGFLNEDNQTMIYSLGNAWVAGPDAKSISVSASKQTLAATGETINITIECENAWILSTSGNSFLTLSSTGDTGTTTITATAPSHSGDTAREEYITFTDSVTGDEAELTVKQKKYTSGQPFYLGADEIAEIYLGADSIAEAYLGEDLVFSSSPSPSPSPAPIGDKTLTISNMGTINGDVETKQITIDGNMSVSVENDSTQETFSPVSTAGYTSSYSNGTITITGPFGNTASLAFYYSTNTAPCLQTNQAETVTFVNNTASTAFDDSVLYTDQECECYQQGGTWEDGGCTYPEPEDPCIADPCMCDPNPDECYCIQQGGTWDGSQCIMPE